MNTKKEEFVETVETVDIAGSVEDRVARILDNSEARESVWARRLGPREDCYSPRDVVNLLRWGATEGDLFRLAECEICRTWVKNYVESSSTISSSEKGVTTSLLNRIATFFGTATHPEQLQRAPALLYFCGDALRVDDPTSVSVEFAIIAGLSDQVEVDPTSLRLEGALVGQGATVAVREVESNLRRPVIHFSRVSVANPLQKDMQRGVSLTEVVRLLGHVVGDPKRGFLGQAYVRLIGAGSASKSGPSATHAG